MPRPIPFDADPALAIQSWTFAEILAHCSSSAFRDAFLKGGGSSFYGKLVYAIRSSPRLEEKTMLKVFARWCFHAGVANTAPADMAQPKYPMLALPVLLSAFEDAKLGSAHIGASERINMRVSPAELEKLDRICAKIGYTRSALLRQWIRDEPEDDTE